jgi:hypothetical protein
MSESKQGSGRLQLSIIAAVFFGPLLFAGWLYYKGELIQPVGKTNNGALLEPIVNLTDTLPGSPIHGYNADFWLLAYENRGNCDESCQKALYTTRQMRLMLGKEMDRVQRIFLHGETPPDTVFLADEHQGLISLQDDALSEFLDQKKPDNLEAGGYFLIDPHGNLVMYFHPELNPGDVVNDIKRLLRLSRIG